VRQALAESGGHIDTVTDADEYSLEEAAAATFRTARCVQHRHEMERCF
jgi:hypothetical protein